MSVKYDFYDDMKVVLITGSSSGIGAAIAVQFAQSGANVVVTGRRADKLAEVAKQCQNVSPKQFKALEVVGDITEKTQCKRLVETTIGQFGRLDILVNNAGIGTTGALSDGDYYDKFESLMQLNLNTTVYLTYLSVDHLSKTGGNIVNISSGAGVRAVAGVSAYCMSKSAMDMFTYCCAAELGPKNIRVNVISPGPVKSTGIMIAAGAAQGTDQSDAIFEHVGQVLPVGRPGRPEEVADAVLFVASDHAQFVTGTHMCVDGGIVAANAFAAPPKH
ncbi:3-oxoacyl-[acyl-carrier-protein] reductase FabG-like [Oppia nitens]|uniref:3-oxoacyl-[acyl-carrier-protein] reductase FabG-like n=1 Tax=Oppia nitens TaxID=1686743 RepID=UPI0023D9AE3B|nr:3-oxoacyl-[acyl-carrier-protein] reductase FabG-like [Oppia nitens]